MKKVILPLMIVVLLIGIPSMTMANTDLGLSYQGTVDIRDINVGVPMRIDVGRMSLNIGNLVAESSNDRFKYSVNYNHPLNIFFSYLYGGVRLDSVRGWYGLRTGIGTRFRVENYVMRWEALLSTDSVIPQEPDDVNIGITVSTQIDVDRALETLNNWLEGEN